MNWENPLKNGRIPKNKWNVAERYMEWVSLTYCATKWVEFVSPFIFGDFGPTLQCEHLNNYYTSRSVSINDMFFRHLFQKKVATPDLCRRSLLVFLFDVHPWAPTTHGKMKVLIPKTLGEITCKNEGWGGSHGRKYIESMPCMISCISFLGSPHCKTKCILAGPWFSWQLLHAPVWCCAPVKYLVELWLSGET